MEKIREQVAALKRVYIDEAQTRELKR